MAERATETVQAVRDQARTLAQSVAEQAAQRAVQSFFRTRDEASKKVTTSGLKDVRKVVNDEVMTSARDVALSAASAALDIWQQASRKAEEVAEHRPKELKEPALYLLESVEKRAKSSREPALHLLETVEKRARETREPARHLVDTVEKRAKATTDVVAQRAESVLETAEEAAERARLATRSAKETTATATRHAADATVSTSKDTGALLFWLGALVAIVLYAFLDENRRKAVISGTKRAVSEGLEIARDLQGRDGSFA